MATGDLSQGLIPDLPRDPKLLDIDQRSINPVWSLFFDQLILTLQTVLTPEGTVMPQQSSDNVALLTAPQSIGNILYNYTTDNFEGNVANPTASPSQEWWPFSMILSNSGSPTGVVAGVAYNFYWDTSNQALWVCTATGDAASATWVEITASGAPGTVTSITAGTGLTATPNPITRTGTISITAVVSPTTAAYPTSITVNAQGQITSITAGSAPSGGTVTSITAGTGLSGGTITTAGTIAIADATANSLAGYDNSGVFDNVTVGTGLNLASGVLTATGGGGTVTSVSGTSGQIVVVDGTTTPIVSIDPTYAGQTSITTLGTVTTGSWHASLIPLAYGGTNTNLTATVNGIVIGTSSGMAFTSAADNAVLITSNTGVPSLSTTLPSGLTIPGYQTTITPAALTEANDTNVTLSLSGTPSTALLEAVEITAGWSGTLSGARGGTGTANTGLTINLGSGSAGLILTSDSSGNATWQTNGYLSGAVLLNPSGKQTISNYTLEVPSLQLSTNNALYDSNGNVILGLIPIASAVNYVSAYNNVTGMFAGFQSQGSDTNIGMTLLTKGTGVFGFNTTATTNQFYFNVGAGGLYNNIFNFPSNDNIFTWPNASGTVALTSQIPVLSLTESTGITLTPSTITGTGTIGISNTTVTAGSYTNLNATINAQGQITAASSGGAGIITVKTQVFTSTGSFTYTPTSSMAYVIVELQGAGGGSGGCAATSGSAGTAANGGAGGGYLRFLLTAAQVGTSLSGSVGAGGSAGTSGNNAGSNGSATTLATASSWSAGGGAGGVGGASESTSMWNGSTPAAGGTNSTGTGTLICSLPGQTGDQALILIGTGVRGARGGDSFLGKGAVPAVSNNSTGAVGIVYGGGAGGGSNGGTQSAVGGSIGAQGIAIFTEYIT